VMLQDFNDWGRHHREALDALEQATATSVGSGIFGKLRSTYSDLPEVLEYLTEVEADLVDSADEFIDDEDPESESPPRRNAPPEPSDNTSFELRASVNVLIDHSESQGAPLVYEDHPTETRLMGRI
jgi:hypothetical protein